jgi:hypothetical protein
MYQHQQPENGFGATGRTASQRAWQRLRRGSRKPRAPSSVDLVMRRSKSPPNTSVEEKDSNTWWECSNFLLHSAWNCGLKLGTECVSSSIVTSNNTLSGTFTRSYRRRWWSEFSDNFLKLL